MTTSTENALDHRARRAAKRYGLIIRKSRRHVGSVDNFGEYMLVDPTTNFAVGGSRYDWSAADVIAYCNE
jgi:hypothetical protein